jgi:adenylate cyclase
MERRLAAILVADVVGYSRLMGADEAGTLTALSRLRVEVIAPLIARHQGRVVKLMGDGILAEFPSVVDAVTCAVAWQSGAARGEHDGALRFRIGINLGDVMVEDGDIYGNGVNVAARLEGLSEPGGVCLSGTVYGEVRNKLDLAFEDLGEQTIKNIAEPVHAYRVAIERPLPPQASATAGAATGTATGAGSSEKPSIAVLPFTNMSGDPEQDYFSDGITEDILTDLSKVSGLHVASRNSAFVYKGAKVKIEDVAAGLRVRFVLEGSVRKAGNQVRITAQLIDGRSGGHLWAERYDRELTNIFQVQDEIAGSIVAALKVTLTPSETRAIEKPPTSDVEAYQYYLRGRQFLREMTRESIELGEQMFQEAIKRDPAYAQAYAGLADCTAVLTTHYDSEPELLETAVGYSSKALELDPTLAEVHASHGHVLTLRDDLVGAARAFRIAIQLDPRFYEAHYYWGLLALHTGAFQEAVGHMGRALKVGGDDLQSAMMLLNAYRGLGREQDIKDAARRTLAITERRLALNPSDQRAHYVGATALVELGDLARAKEWAQVAASMESADPRTHYNLGCLFALLGEADLAIAHVERSIQEGGAKVKINWMRQDPDLDALREDPRFEAVLAKYEQGEGR